MSDVKTLTGTGPGPKLGASASVWKEGRVLLVKRAKPPFMWAFPGGHVEFGETTLAAAARELAEETGIAAELTQLIGLYDIIRTDVGVHYVIACHGGVWKSGEAVAASDASEARWFLPEEVEALELAPNILDAIRTARVTFG